MNSLIRPRVIVAAGLALVALIAATQLRGTSAQAGEQQPHQLAVGTQGSTQPQNMDAVPDRRHQGRRRLLDEGVRRRRAAGAARQLPAASSPARPLNSACGELDDSTAAYCPGDDTITISEQLRRRHLLRRAGPRAARQLAGLRRHDGRLRGRVRRRARVRPPDPGRARRLRPERADREHRAAGRLLRRQLGQERLRRGPPRRRRHPGGAQRRPGRRRLRHRQPRPPRHAGAARGGVDAAASSPATRPPAAPTSKREAARPG